MIKSPIKRALEFRKDKNGFEWKVSNNGGFYTRLKKIVNYWIIV